MGAQGSDLTLNVLIKSVLDAKGFKATDAEVAQLTTSFTEAAKAGEPLAITAETVAKKLEEVRASADSAASAIDKTAKATSGVTEEMKDQAQAAARWNEINEKNAASADNAAKNIGSLKLGFSGLSGVIRGSLTGDLTQVGQGLFNIRKAVAEAGGSVRSLFSQIARGGAIGGVFAAPAVAGLILLEKQAAKTRAEIEKIYAKRDAASAAQKEQIATNDAAAKKSLEAQIKDVDALIARYQALIAAMDSAAQHAAAVNEATNKRDLAKIDRDEQAALAKAKTPEEAAKISAAAADARRSLGDRSAANDLINADLQAGVRRRNAQDALVAAQREIDAAETEARRKRTAADEAIAVSGQALRRDGAGSGNYQRAAAAANAAKDEADRAQQNLSDVRGKVAPVIEAANKQIETANNTAELVRIQREALVYQQQAAAQKDSNATVPRAKELRDKAQSAMEAGDYAAQDQAVKGLADIRTQQSARTAELKRTTATLAATLDDHAIAQRARDDVIIKAINGQAAKADQTARQLKNSR